MEGIVKCDDCGEDFDVDDLRYDDALEKFVCPHCGSDKFRPLVEVDSPDSK